MTAWRGVNVLAGELDRRRAVVTVPCSLGTIVLAVLTIEFLASVPAPARHALDVARAR